MNFLAHLIVNRPWAVVIGYGVLAGLGAISALLWLTLNTDTNALVSPTEEYNQRYHRYLEAFGDQDYMYVVVEVENLETAMKVADAVAVGVAPLVDSGVLTECIHRVEIGRMLNGALLHLPSLALDRLTTQVRENLDTLRVFLRTNTIAGLLDFLRGHADTELASQYPAASRIGCLGSDEGARSPDVWLELSRALGGEESPHPNASPSPSPARVAIESVGRRVVCVMARDGSGNSARG